MRALALAVLTLTLSGCMDSDESRVSDREFSERTNAACRAFLADSVFPRTFSPDDFTPSEWSRELNRAEVWLAELRGIRSPAQVEREWRMFLSAMKRLIRADRDLYGVSPRPKPGSTEWRRAEMRANAAERQIQLAASALPLGIACRTG